MGEILLLIFGVTASGLAAIGGYFKWQGDADIALLVDKVTKIFCSRQKGYYELKFEIPLVNQGKQNGMLMEVFSQPAYCGKIMEQVAITSRCRLKNEEPRKDWYWESVIIKKNTSHTLEGSVIINYQGSSKQLATELSELTLVFHTKTLGRKKIDLKVNELILNLKEILKVGDGPSITG